MSTVASLPPQSLAKPSTASPYAATVVLRGVSWQTYEQLCDEIPARMPHSYDEGVLELMTHSFRQDRRLSRLLDVLTEELSIPILSAGAMTLKKKSLLKGVEPDGVFWIANETAMRGRHQFDPETDPPPDLVIETEISRTVLDRLSLLAALGVGEVWRSTEEGITAMLLSKDGTYEEVSQSGAMPFLTVADLSPFLAIDDAVSETARMREFRQWVRERFADRLPSA